jgi:FkbM family methyltransferase
VVDRRKLSAAARRARRERVQRRANWATPTQTNQVLTLTAHGRSIRLYDAQGKIPACWRAGVPYEKPLLDHIYAERFTGLAVDAGANIGNHTLWFAGICGLDVAAFEPIKHTELARNVDLNELGDKITVHPSALGVIDGQALHVGKGRLATGKGTLPVRDLDGYGLTDVAVIKVDVEGMEPQVLAGAEYTIRDQRPVIFAEEWGQPEHAAIAAVLEPWGYRLTRRFSGKGSATPVGRWDP